jgi:hypothetical protein
MMDFGKQEELKKKRNSWYVPYGRIEKGRRIRKGT